MQGKEYVLRIGDTVFTVHEQDFREYYRELERWKYIRRMEKGKKLSYEKAVEDELPLERLSAAEGISLEDEIVQKIMIERMLEAIELLEEGERRLIRQLFFSGLTAREIARQRGVTHRAVLKQRNRILIKLKKILEIF
jgi:RNA polymerase sigma factor (sigma-70 family)